MRVTALPWTRTPAIFATAAPKVLEAPAGRKGTTLGRTVKVAVRVGDQESTSFTKTAKASTDTRRLPAGAVRSEPAMAVAGPSIASRACKPLPSTATPRTLWSSTVSLLGWAAGGEDAPPAAGGGLHGMRLPTWLRSTGPGCQLRTRRVTASKTSRGTWRRLKSSTTTGPGTDRSMSRSW
jgi:hypothetical protein